jgi:hypothetical protein
VEKMNWSRFFAAGVVTAIARFLIDTLSGFKFQALYDPSSGLWKAMGTPSWIQNVLLSHVIIAFIAVFAYALVNTSLGKRAEKGVKFGFLIWMVQDIPGALLTYAFMAVPTQIIGVWIGTGLLIQLINGQLIARIYK